MFVCNCNGIRERDVLRSIEAGHRHPEQIHEALDCVPKCGRCLDEIRDMIDASINAWRQAAE